MALSVEFARTAGAIEELRLLWDAVPWEREEAEADYFLARVAARGASPYAVIVHAEGRPLAAAAGRIENRRLAVSVGYRTVYAPEVRALQIVDGGLYAADPSALALLCRSLRQSFDDDGVEVLSIPALPVASSLLAALESLGLPQRLIAPWPRRLLRLPGSFDAFVASRTRKIRFGIRYDAKRLLAEHGHELDVAVLREPVDFDRYVSDLETIARSAYQRAVGGGFVDDAEQRELTRIGLERGWLRAYVLSIAGAPVAYWLVATYKGRALLKTTGYDPAFARHRVGIYLLMRVIEDVDADPALDVLDFGPGDASYKRQFSSDAFDERNALVYAPTLRARRIRTLRTGVLLASVAARRVLDSSGLTARLRTAWRARRRSASR